jgi:hypothetical protein
MPFFPTDKKRKGESSATVVASAVADATKAKAVVVASCDDCLGTPTVNHIIIPGCRTEQRKGRKEKTSERIQGRRRRRRSKKSF